MFNEGCVCSSDWPISSKQLNAQLLSLLYKNRLFSRLKFSFNHKDWIVCWLTWTPLCGRTHSLLDPDFLLETIWIKTCFWKTCKYNYLLEDCLNMPSTILNVCLFIFNTCEYKGLFIQGQILPQQHVAATACWVMQSILAHQRRFKQRNLLTKEPSLVLHLTT